jgi:hypothetical protein
VTRAPVDHSIEARPSFSNLFKASPVTAHNAGAEDTAIAYAEANGLTVDDKRSRGGSLWIKTGDGDDLLNERLARWGFRHSAGRGWWRAN